MVEQRSPHHDGLLDATFGALADPTRRAMLRALSHGSSTVGELARPYPISLAAASKHIQVLERAGLVKRTVQGRVHHCELDVRPMHAGFEWIRHYEHWWNRKLDVLEDLLQREIAVEKARASKKKPPSSKSAVRTRTAKRSKP